MNRRALSTFTEAGDVAEGLLLLVVFYGFFSFLSIRALLIG